MTIHLKKLLDFRNKKYGEILVDLKKLNKEFNKNEKLKKKFFALKNKNPREADFIKKDIIW